MGAIHVDVTIRNPADPSRSWRGPFLVDTGATDCVVPRQHLEAIGVTPDGQRAYALANGRQARMDVAVARIEFMDDLVGGTVVFGKADSEPLLGMTALESMGVEVVPRNQELRKLPAVRLKELRPLSATHAVAPVEYKMPISALTVDKLGVKLYDRASAVIAELLSNSYDADATEVAVRAPLGKYLATVADGELRDRDYTVEISDNGIGMTPAEMNNFFLPVGIERRNDPGRGSKSKRFDRKVMGRKGVGKLAPFGICKVIEVRSAGGKKMKHTMPDGRTRLGYLASHIILNYDDIVKLGRVSPSETYRPLPGADDCTVSSCTGTRIILRNFYRKRIPEASVLTRQIAQRFGIRSDNWKITVFNSDPDDNSDPRPVDHFDVQTMPNTMLTFRTDGTVVGPDDQQLENVLAGFRDDAGHFRSLSGWMAYSKHPYRDELMAGVRIYCRGKIASQTSVFNRRAGFTGEHNIRSYLVGELHADWLDDENDLILTDRRDILWSDRLGEQLQEWGQRMVAMIGRFARDPLRKATLDLFLENGNVKDRINSRLPGAAHQDMRSHALDVAKMFGRTMSRSDVEDPGVLSDLVDLAILLAPHMTLNKMMRAADSADTPISLVSNFLRIARIAEVWSFGRIAQDRVRIIKRLRKLIGKSSTTESSLQALIREAPWLINPEWAPVTANQTFRTLRQHFQEYYTTAHCLNEFGEPEKRPDFVLTCQKGTIQIVEIKAPGHNLAREELKRIVTYHDCMEAFLDEPGNHEFAEQFRSFHITLVCDRIQLSGYDLHAMTGLRQRLTHITWASFLRRAEQIHEDFLREANRFPSALGRD